MNAKTISELQKAMSDANASMARYMRAAEGLPKVSTARLAQLEMDARAALATLAACIEREDVF